MTLNLASMVRDRLAWAAPFAPAIGAVVLALVVVQQCNGRRAAESRVAQMIEAAELAAKGQEVVDQVEDVDPRVEQLAAENADLKAALDKARAAARGAKAIAAEHVSTGAIIAAGAPRGPVPDVQGAPATPCPACLLAEGDQGEVRVDEVVLETRGGNHLLVGAAAAWRLAPGPETRLFGGPFSAPLTEAEEQAQPPAPGWGAGAAAGFTGTGWVAGVTALTPEKRIPIIARQGGLVFSGAGGPGGFVGLASIYVR